MITIPSAVAFPLWRWLFWQSEFSQGLRKSQWWGYEAVAVEGFVRARFQLEQEGRLPQEVEKFYLEFLAFMRKMQAANAVATKRRLGILPRKSKKKGDTTSPKPPMPERVERLVKYVIWWYGRFWNSKWRFEDTPEIAWAALTRYRENNPKGFEVQYPLVVKAIRNHFSEKAARERTKEAHRKLRVAEIEAQAARQTKLFERTEHH